MLLLLGDDAPIRAELPLIPLSGLREATSVGALRARLAEFETTIAALEGERAAWREQTDTLHDERAALQVEVKLLRVGRDLHKKRAEAIARRLFAAKSEQSGLHQRDLFFNEVAIRSVCRH